MKFVQSFLLLTTSMFQLSNGECYDYPFYRDGNLNSCLWYTVDLDDVISIALDDDNASRCSAYGDNYPSPDNGLVPNEACCICGGGLPELPSSTPSVSPTRDPASTRYPSSSPSTPLPTKTSAGCIQSFQILHVFLLSFFGIANLYIYDQFSM